MTMPLSILFDEVSARLPLFEDLPQDAPERLAAAGLGRGLLTAAVRGRLRKAGFLDMSTLALATPTALMKVRKIGPVRFEALRSHILNELARIYPEARALHAADSTASRRMNRLRNIPADRLPLEGEILTKMGCANDSCAALAMRGRSEFLKTRAVVAGDLDRIVITLARFLLHERPRPILSPLRREGEQPREDARELRASMLREQDREWEDAAPNVRSRNT